MKTVKDLLEILKDIPEDTPIATYRSNMEGSGYTDKYIRVSVEEMYRIKEQRSDAFDGTTYHTDVLRTYTNDPEAIPIKVLVIE